MLKYNMHKNIEVVIIIITSLKLRKIEITKTESNKERLEEWIKERSNERKEEAMKLKRSRWK